MRSFLVFIVLLIPTVINAQNKVSEKSTVQWGTSVALDFNFPYDCSTQTRYNPFENLGFSMGGNMRVNIHKGWLVETGLLIGYDHTNLDGAEENSTIKLDRWRLTVPVMGGYRFTISPMRSITPLLGVEYNYYFSTTTAGQRGEPRYSSSQLWHPYSFAGCGGVGFGIENFEVDVLAHVNLMNGNKKEYQVTKLHNYLPIQVTVTAKMFF
ncbi:MAG: PorT family protein [Duncaniella sp.]|nr:PorT family protein [Duncaniella sp.]